MSELAKTLPPTVLVVDDEPGVVRLLTSALAKVELEVRGARDVSEAMALIQRERFGCLLVDKNLPDQSGLELLRFARVKQPFCSCVVMTAFPTAPSVVEAMRLGAVDYLEKPFPELGLVAQRMRSTLERARTAFEREVLARALENMRTELKRSEGQVAERETALQVFTNVLNQRVEQAGQQLSTRVYVLETAISEALAKAQLLTAPNDTVRSLIEVLSAAVNRG